MSERTSERVSTSMSDGGGDATKLSLLSELARIATQDLDLDAMLQRITDALAHALGWELVACVGIDLERDRFVCHALTTSLPTEIHPGYSRAIGSGVVGEVARSGEPALLDDVRGAANYVETTEGVLAEICVPIKHQGRVVALLNAESTRLGAFHGQLPLVEAIAGQVAGAIASARLHETLNRRAEQLQMMSELSRAALDAVEIGAILDRVTAYVHSRFGFAVTSFFLASDDAREFTLASRQGAGPAGPEPLTCPATVGIVGRAMRTRTRQLVLDVTRDADYLQVDEHVVAECAIPALFRGGVLGVLNVESHDAEALSRETLTALEMLVDQVAGAIYLAAANRRLEATSRALEESNRRLHEAVAELERLSTIDPLTGVANRRRLDHVLSLEWRRAARSEAPLSLLMIDIDHFKAYNDRYGHQQGDACLARVANAVASQANRAAELLARYGGEEFALVAATDGAGAASLAAKLREVVESLAIEHEGADSGRVTISVGVASMVPTGGCDPSELVARADQALYEAKRRGRNRVAVAGAGPG